MVTMRGSTVRVRSIGGVLLGALAALAPACGSSPAVCLPDADCGTCKSIGGCPARSRLYLLMSGDIVDIVAAPAAVEIVDVPTVEFVDTIPLGDRYPTSIAVSPDGQRVWIADFLNGEVAAYDALGGQELATVAVPGAFDLAMSPNGSRLFVSAEGQVAAIDTATTTIAGSYETAPRSPLGIAVDGTGTRLVMATTTGGTDPHLLAFDTSVGLSLLDDIPVAGDVAGCDASPNDVVLMTTDRALAWDSNCDSLYQFDLAAGVQLPTIIDTGRDMGSSANSNNALVFSDVLQRAFVVKETQEVLTIDPAAGAFDATPVLGGNPFVIAGSVEGKWTAISVGPDDEDLALMQAATHRMFPFATDFLPADGKHVRDMRFLPFPPAP